MNDASDSPHQAGSAKPPGFLGWRAVARERRAGIAASVAFAVVMSVYLRTMMPGPAFMDTGEFQTVTYVLGIAHPTGYPLYTLLGKLFGTLLPLGSWAFRMNLMSVLSAAMAAALLVLISIRYGVPAVVAVAAAFCFAFALNTWRAADKADPYTLTVFIGAAIWLMTAKWAETGDRRWLWTVALVSGLGLGSAGVLSMELPATVLYAIIAQPRKFFRPVTMIVAGLAGVVSLVAIYTYLPLRASMNPPLNYGNTYTWEGFRFVALGGQVGGVLNYLTWEGLRRFVISLPQAAGWYGEWLTPWGRAFTGFLGLIGLGTLAIRDWRMAICTALGFIVPMFPTLTMPINDTTHYLLISNWLLFFAAAVGFGILVTSPIERFTTGRLRRALHVTATMVLLPPIILARVNWSNADMHGYHDAELLAHGVFERVKPRAVIFCWWGPSNALWYAHFVDGLRPDVDVYDDSTTLDRGWGGVTPAIGLFYPKRPVYSLPIGDQVDAIEKKYNLIPVADLKGLGQTLYEVAGPRELTPPAAP